MTEDEVLRQTVEVLGRKKVALDSLSIVILMQLIVDDPRMGLTHAALQQWYREASSQAIFIMYNRVAQLYSSMQKK